MQNSSSEEEAEIEDYPPLSSTRGSAKVSKTSKKMVKKVFI